jgi:hypothetical protein
MDTPIGTAAGRIWPYLAESGKATLPARRLLMGVGWLAREDTRCVGQERGGLKRSWRER